MIDNALLHKRELEICIKPQKNAISALIKIKDYFCQA